MRNFKEMKHMIIKQVKNISVTTKKEKLNWFTKLFRNPKILGYYVDCEIKYRGSGFEDAQTGAVINIGRYLFTVISSEKGKYYSFVSVSSFKAQEALWSPKKRG